MVVLRSTTPCVAVNSRSNSALLTVISIVPTAVPAAITASTGIDFVSPAACYFYYFPYTKYKTYKTSSNSRRGAEVENYANLPVLTALPTTLRVRNRYRTRRSQQKKISASANSIHTCTASTSNSQPYRRKTALLRAKRQRNVIYPPNCSVSLLRSLFKSLSFLRTSSIFSTECSTVV